MNYRNQILVAFDRSPEAEKAVEHALAIAEPDDEILILWIIPEPDPSFFLDIPEEFSIEEASDHLDSLKTKYQDTKLQIITKVCQGNIIEEILKASEKPECKLIVMGYKGVSRLGGFKLGSVSGMVAKKANKPLLIVR